MVPTERRRGGWGGERHRDTETQGGGWIQHLKWEVREKTHQDCCQVTRKNIWVVIGALYFDGKDPKWNRFKRKERESGVHLLVCLICADVYEISKGKYEEGS